MQIDRHAGAPQDRVEAFQVAPVYEAVIAARLRDLQAGLHSPADTATQPGDAVARIGRLRAIRVRLGHAIVTLGAFVEGPPDCPPQADLSRTRKVT